MSTLEATRHAGAPIAPTAAEPGRFAWARRWWVALALLILWPNMVLFLPGMM